MINRQGSKNMIRSCGLHFLGYAIAVFLMSGAVAVYAQNSPASSAVSLPAHSNEAPGDADLQIHQQLQQLKQQSIALDRDLILLEDKVMQPLSVYVSQFADAKFKLESLVLTLDDKPLAKFTYQNRHRQALEQGGAQLVFKGMVAEGKHTLVAYYTSDKGYQGGVEYTLVKQPMAQSIEFRLLKDQSKESRLRPLMRVIDGKARD